MKFNSMERLFAYINYCLNRFRDVFTPSEAEVEWLKRFNELQSLRQKIEILTDRMVQVNQSPASIFSPLLADLSNVLSVLMAYLGTHEISLKLDFKTV